MQCIDLSNRAWPVTGQGATTIARYLKLRSIPLRTRLILKIVMREIRESMTNILALLKVISAISLISELLC